MTNKSAGLAELLLTLIATLLACGFVFASQFNNWSPAWGLVGLAMLAATHLTWWFSDTGRSRG